MTQNRRIASIVFLILGMTFLAIGFGMNNTAFSAGAIVFVVLSLVLGGRWMRPRK